MAAVSYRLAPQSVWPAQREDVLAAIAWLKANALKLGLDPTRLVLLGRSAGGQLAAAVGYGARDPAIRAAAAINIRGIRARIFETIHVAERLIGKIHANERAGWFIFSARRKILLHDKPRSPRGEGVLIAAQKRGRAGFGDGVLNI